MPRTQGNLIRFTSFGSTVNSLSRNDGQPASNNPPTQNQFSRAPIGIEGFPPLPKRKGSAVQAIQEAEAAGSAAARLAAKSHLQQQQQQQQQRRDQQQKTQQAPSPLTAQQHSQQHSATGGPGNAPKVIESSSQLHMRCKNLEEQLQQHQQQASLKASALAAGLHQLLATLKHQGYEVAAGLDSLQDELYDDMEVAAHEEADGSLQQSKDACDDGPSAQAGAHLADPSLDSLHTSHNPSSRGVNGETHSSCSNAHSAGNHDVSADREEIRPGAVRDANYQPGLSPSSGSQADQCSVPTSGCKGVHHIHGAPIAAASSGVDGALQQVAGDRRGQPPEKLVVLRAKRDHVETEFIELMRSSVAGLERLLNEV